MNMEVIRDYSYRIPELGYGGKTIGNDLIEYASKIPSGFSIVDIGPYLGSTTIHLGAGVNKSGNDVIIHAYDRWIMDDGMDTKAKKFNGIDFNHGQDVLDIYRKNINPIKDIVIIHPCNILDASYSGRPVMLLVDDICNGKQRTDTMMKIFSPFFVAGKTVVCMMDFYYHEHKKGMKLLRYQYDFMVSNKKVFRFIKKIKNSMTAVFVFEGGDINYNVKGFSYEKDKT